MKSKSPKIRSAFLILLAAATGFSAMLAWTTAVWQKSLLDHISPDGNFERLPLQTLQQIRPIFIVLFFCLGAILFLFIWKKDLYLRCLNFVQDNLHALIQDTKSSWSVLLRTVRQRDIWLDAAVLFLIAALLRFFWLSRPLEHDEAFTYYVFARLPFRYALADYTYPNNHLFHTFLLKLAVSLLGDASWVLRLPVFLFGSALAPLVYLFARQSTHQRWTAFLAGMGICFYSTMVLYSVNARGYSLEAIFTILATWIAWGLMRKKNRFLWLIFSLSIILGLYTLPIMLLPAGGLFTWFFINGLLGALNREYSRWGWLKYLLASGLLIIAGTLLLYLPVFLYSGIDSLIANPYVAPLTTAEFPPTLHDRLKDLWQEWTAGFPLWVSLSAAATMLIGIFNFERKTNNRFSLFISLLLFLSIYSVLQRPNLWPRVLYYFTPFLMLALAFGISFLIQWFLSYTHLKSRLQPCLAYSLSGLLLLGTLLQTPNYTPLPGHIKGDTEQLAEYLSTRWQPDTLILVDYPEDMPFYVYMENVGLPPSAVRWESPFKDAYILVNTSEKQTIESVVQNRGPELAFFDLQSSHLVLSLPDTQLYHLRSNWELVQREYKKQSP